MPNDSITITCLGDIAPIEPAAGILLSDTHAYKAHLKSLFAQSNAVFANLEAPLTTTATPTMADKKYALAADPGVLDAFPEKFVFSIANNHILDCGVDGLIETTTHLTGKKIRYTGAGKNLDDAGKPALLECRGQTIALLAAADTRCHAATKTEPGVFPADPAILLPRISQLAKNADIVYVSIHMGMEFIPVPAPKMFDLAHACHQAGAHVVLFHHAHCVSGYTISGNKATLWGVGNFLFPEVQAHHFAPWFETAAWHIIHQMSENTIRADVEPFILDKNGLSQKPETTAGNKIIQRIDFLSRRINHKDRLGWLRLASMCKPDYINLFIGNYADMARRKGLRHVAKQIASAINTLFLKNPPTK